MKPLGGIISFSRPQKCKECKEQSTTMYLVGHDQLCLKCYKKSLKPKKETEE